MITAIALVIVSFVDFLDNNITVRTSIVPGTGASTINPSTQILATVVATGQLYPSKYSLFLTW
jgi:hypothetical protein